MWSSIVAIIVFLIFEVGIRFIPADGMTYVATNGRGQIVYTYSTSDQAVISSWQKALNTAPQDPSYTPNCDLPPQYTPVYRTYTFTWHGIPVESAWNNDGGDPLYLASNGNPCPIYIVSNGGIPNVFTRSAPQQDAPAEPPNSH